MMSINLAQQILRRTLIPIAWIFLAISVIGSIGIKIPTIILILITCITILYAFLNISNSSQTSKRDQPTIKQYYDLLGASSYPQQDEDHNIVNNLLIVFVGLLLILAAWLVKEGLVRSYNWDWYLALIYALGIGGILFLILWLAAKQQKWMHTCSLLLIYLLIDINGVLFFNWLAFYEYGRPVIDDSIRQTMLPQEVDRVLQLIDTTKQSSFSRIEKLLIDSSKAELRVQNIEQQRATSQNRLDDKISKERELQSKINKYKKLQFLSGRDSIQINNDENELKMIKKDINKLTNSLNSLKNDKDRVLLLLDSLKLTHRVERYRSENLNSSDWQKLNDYRVTLALAENSDVIRDMNEDIIHIIRKIGDQLQLDTIKILAPIAYTNLREPPLIAMENFRDDLFAWGKSLLRTNDAPNPKSVEETDTNSRRGSPIHEYPSLNSYRISEKGNIIIERRRALAWHSLLISVLIDIIPLLVALSLKITRH